MSTDYPDKTKDLSWHYGTKQKQFLTIALDDCMSFKNNRLKTYKQTPACVLLGFSVAVVMVAVFTVANAVHRVDLEGFSFPTALGDQNWFQLASLPEPHDLGKPLFTYRGRELYQMKRKPLRYSDKLMLKADREDSGQYYLYRYNGNSGKNRENSLAAGVYYIKTGSDQYIRVGNARLEFRK